jgi:hypothetical protein
MRAKHKMVENGRLDSEWSLPRSRLVPCDFGDSFFPYPVTLPWLLASPWLLLLSFLC